MFSAGCGDTELYSGLYSIGATELTPAHTCQTCKRHEQETTRNFQPQVKQSFSPGVKLLCKCSWWICPELKSSFTADIPVHSYMSRVFLKDIVFCYKGNFTGFDGFWNGCVKTSCPILKFFVSIHHHFLEYCRRIWYDRANNGAVPKNGHITTSMSVTESNNRHILFPASKYI